MSPVASWSERLGRMAGSARSFRLRTSSETIALAAAVFFTAFCNNPFWREALAGHDWTTLRSWYFAFGTFVFITSLHFLTLCIVFTRWTTKPLMTGLLVATAAATFYMGEYRVFLDDDLLRAILHTEVYEARELLTPRFFWHLVVFSALPVIALSRVELRERSLARTAAIRVGCVVLGVIGIGGGALLAFQDLSSLVRNRREVRYLVTPGNFLVATGKVLFKDVARARATRQVVGADASLVPRAPGARPRLLVIVVGETARAANWGLNGYTRQTTPELAGLSVVNFPHATACGTSTEVSVPCMFSMVGRRDYDESRIEREESVLHVLAHAGVATLWRDNQTGCKHVCDGLAIEHPGDGANPALCHGDSCHDEVLLQGLPQLIAARNGGDFVIVLHPLGNHGPSYYARYPERFRRYMPTCDSAELGQCTQQQVVNSYDNALLYADHVVAETIRILQAQTSHDAALIYVSDHGESLGEHGLYLHGVPYSIAPVEQTSIPMIAWLSDGLRQNLSVDTACLRERAKNPVTHDNLSHSVLGLVGVQTRVYERTLDLFSTCRTQPPS